MIGFTEEQRMLQETAKKFAEQELQPVAAELDEKEKFNDAAFRKMGPLGVLGITVPTEYGGGGGDAVSATIVMEEFGRCCASTTLSYLAHSILCVNNIFKNGTEEQKKKYLPKLCSGEWIGAMAMSEPEHGSDVVLLETKAKQDGDNFILNGTKTWTTNGLEADVFVVYARTGEEGAKGISAFIVEKGTKGFTVGKKLEKLGMRASSTTELNFENCKIPKENLLGKLNNGTAQMMSTLDIERTTIAGISLGISKAAVELMLWYGEERKQFNAPILDYQHVQRHLADASLEYEAASALVYKVAAQCATGERVTRQAASAKVFAAEAATKAGLSAIQVLGGYGYTREYPAERFLRDAKLMEIGAGTSEIMRHIIVRDLRRGK